MGCRSHKETPNSLYKTWMLIEFKGFEKPEFSAKNASIYFHENNSASAKMGCNNIGLQYETNGEKMKITLDKITFMHCEDMKLEREFSKAIKETSHFKIEGHKLYLYLKNGDKIVFVETAWD